MQVPLYKKKITPFEPTVLPKLSHSHSKKSMSIHQLISNIFINKTKTGIYHFRSIENTHLYIHNYTLSSINVQKHNPINETCL